MPSNPHQDWTRKMWAAGILLLLTVVALILSNMQSCGEKRSPPVVVQPAAPLPSGDEPARCGELAVGDTREETCPAGAGRRVSVCTASGLQQAFDTCAVPAPAGCDALTGSVTFAAVQPILTRACSGCHAGYDSYATAKAKVDRFIERVSLIGENPLRMPQPPRPELAGGEKKAISDWKAQGLCPAPGGAPPGGGVRTTLAPLEQRLLEDLTSVEPRIRRSQRYLTGVHLADQMQTGKLAASKALASLSNERIIAAATAVEPGIWRFDLDRLGLTAADWRLVEQSDKLDLESFTSAGQLLKLLSGSRKVWIPVDGFGDAALRTSKTYYALTRIPATFQQLIDQLGVDYAADLRRFDAQLAGTFTSPLSPQNRLISVHRSKDGAEASAAAGGAGLWCTYDTGVLDTAEKNLSEFPCLADIGCQRNLQFVAGECFFARPSGMLGFVLYAARQIAKNVGGRPVFVRSDLAQRLDQADPAVVHDFRLGNPLAPIIVNAISCFACHSGGILPVTDSIFASVKANGSEFGQDKDLILAAYGGDDHAARFNARIAAANDEYRAALTKIGVDPTAPDPITTLSDKFLGTWDLAKVARILLLDPTTFGDLLSQSATARAQVGQLLTPQGTITYDQLVQSLPTVKRELRLFQDPLIGG